MPGMMGPNSKSPFSSGVIVQGAVPDSAQSTTASAGSDALSSSMTTPSRGSPETSTRVPLMEPPAMSMVLTSGVPTIGIVKPTSSTVRVPSSKITVTS